MVDETERLISEVQQIETQYVAEVGQGRRMWPRSIKERVARLDELGIAAKAIATKTGISYETIILWRYKRRQNVSQVGFHEVAVGGSGLPAISKSVTVTVPESEIPNSRPRDLRLTTPGGFVIEGLDEQTLIALIARLSQGGRHAS
jgi:hypothetical protein